MGHLVQFSKVQFTIKLGIHQIFILEYIHPPKYNHVSEYNYSPKYNHIPEIFVKNETNLQGEPKMYLFELKYLKRCVSNSVDNISWHTIIY